MVCVSVVVVCLNGPQSLNLEKVRGRREDNRVGVTVGGVDRLGGEAAGSSGGDRNGTGRDMSTSLGGVSVKKMKND